MWTKALLKAETMNEEQYNQSHLQLIGEGEKNILGWLHALFFQHTQRADTMYCIQSRI